MTDTRTGIGYDAHAFGGVGPVVLCGVPIDHPTGVVGTSDADVAVHAVCDALLGAAALGDLGEHFPSVAASSIDADSLEMLSTCTDMVNADGYTVSSIDVTIIAQQVRVAPHRDRMRTNLANATSTSLERVSVKGTTTDHLGWIGRNEGLAAVAVVTIAR
ncbi:MAG: 2-C-methyl-D-erythritol 2,4-cyclodiphosphate synthase [Acidimicrobiia bacterium]